MNNEKKTDSKSNPKSYRKLWISLTAVMAISFLVLGYYAS